VEDQVRFQASLFVRGKTDCDNCMVKVKVKADPMHVMKAYRKEQRYISTHP
jgi:hypothetical protein